MVLGKVLTDTACVPCSFKAMLCPSDEILKLANPKLYCPLWNLGLEQIYLNYITNNGGDDSTKRKVKDSSLYVYNENKSYIRNCGVN